MCLSINVLLCWGWGSDTYHWKVQGNKMFLSINVTISQTLIFNTHTTLFANDSVSTIEEKSMFSFTSPVNAHNNTHDSTICIRFPLNAWIVALHTLPDDLLLCCFVFKKYPLTMHTSAVRKKKKILGLSLPFKSIAQLFLSESSDRHENKHPLPRRRVVQIQVQHGIYHCNNAYVWVGAGGR